MSEQIAVRLATADDASVLGALIRAIDIHYRDEAVAPMAEAAAAMVRRTIETREGTEFALAECAGQAVGLAAFAILRPGRDLQGVLYAKEIFVRAEARGQGAGEALLTFLKGEAQRRGIGRIDLTTDPANIEAQRFYERHGGERTEKVAYRFWLPNES
jgi:ribosomal protein S18 acetylase RimI-like enzyme